MQISRWLRPSQTKPKIVEINALYNISPKPNASGREAGKIKVRHNFCTVWPTAKIFDNEVNHSVECSKKLTELL